MVEQPLILIVDDEASFREIFAVKLKGAGYRVETATNGQEGIDKAKALRPALILMDVNMPVMDGATAVLQLRADPDPMVKGLKVVFLTNLGDPRTAAQEAHTQYAQDFGAQGYLKKSDDLDSLVEKIKGFLG